MTIRSMVGAELQVARERLQSGDIGGFYKYIARFGHRYPDLALGVYNESPPSGIVALSFMRQTAMQVGRALTSEEVEAIKGRMAAGYLDALADQLRREGAVTREVNANETWGFHNEVFTSVGLPKDAWTLNTPFKLYGNDNAARETVWRGILDGQSSLLHEDYIGNRSYALIWAVGCFSADPAVGATGDAVGLAITRHCFRWHLHRRRALTANRFHGVVTSKIKEA